MIICVHDDRATAVVGVQLAVASIARHAPGTRVVASLKAADDATRAWFAARPDVELIVDEDFGGTGWDVKPALLLRRLETEDEVVWWDSDIVANGDFRELFRDVGREVLVSTEDVFWGQEQRGDYRARAWGFPVGRVLPATVNTGVLRVTRAHRPLLEAWQQCMLDPAYREAQRTNIKTRPLHLLGDQEVLTALLCSEQFASVPVQLLRRGVEVAQCFGPSGFRAGERVRSLVRWGGAPPIVHSTNPKPWVALDPSADRRVPRRASRVAWRTWYKSLHAELSTYTVLARGYTSELQHDQPWLRSSTPVGRVLAQLPGDKSVVPELPLAALDGLVRLVRRELAIGRYRLDDVATAPVAAPPA